MKTKLLPLMLLAGIALSGCGTADTAADSFVRVENGQFLLNDKPYYFIGTNFWYGPILGSQGPDGDRGRLQSFDKRDRRTEPRENMLFADLRRKSRFVEYRAGLLLDAGDEEEDLFLAAKFDNSGECVQCRRVHSRHVFHLDDEDLGLFVLLHFISS